MDRIGARSGLPVPRLMSPLRSFRFRLGLWVAGLTTCILVGATFFLLRNVFDAKLNQTDQELRSTALSVIPRLADLGRPAPDLRRLQRNVDRISEKSLSWVAFSRPDGSALYASPTAPQTYQPADASKDAAQDRPQMPLNPRERATNIRRFLDSDRNGRNGALRNFLDRIDDAITYQFASHSELEFRTLELNFPDGSLLTVGRNMDRLRSEMLSIRRQALRLYPIVLLAVVGMSVWLAHRAFCPFQKLAGDVENVRSDDLSQRLSDARLPTEFHSFIAAINQMLGRLEQSFSQANRFTADAAHELRTPLTILQGNIEQQLHTADEQTLPTYSRLLDEVKSLQILVDRLLTLSRGDAGSLLRDKASVSINALIREIVEDLEILYEDRPFQLEAPSEHIVSGDPQLLRQLFLNLLTNALKYGATGGTIHISIRSKNSEIHIIEIANDGRNISTEVREKLFDRFYRAEDARTSTGFGLGLPLAQEIARAHGGSLIYAGHQAGRNIFRITLQA